MEEMIMIDTIRELAINYYTISFIIGVGLGVLALLFILFILIVAIIGVIKDNKREREEKE